MDFFGQSLITVYFQINRTTIAHCINHHLWSHSSSVIFPLDSSLKLSMYCLSSPNPPFFVLLYDSGAGLRKHLSAGAMLDFVSRGRGRDIARGRGSLPSACVWFLLWQPLTQAAYGWAPRSTHAPASFASTPAESHEHLRGSQRADSQLVTLGPQQVVSSQPWLEALQQISLPLNRHSQTLSNRVWKSMLSFFQALSFHGC